MNVFEKILVRLEECKKIMLSPKNSDCYGEECKEVDCVACGFDKAIEIVKETASEYSGGWIPCSDHLPKENGYYYVTQIVKSISTGEEIAVEKAYVEFSGGEWRRAKHLEVIAWLDIEPYQPKGE